MSDHELPVNRAILWILLSTLFVSGSAFMGWLYYLHVRDLRFHDDQYRIVALVQCTPQADVLKTVYLAELLDLSLDRPLNLYQFKAAEATHTLTSHPLIKEATVKKILPGTLYIDYSMRTPIAFVGDFANTVIDDAGVLFPFSPFFTPKRLPTLYLGLNAEDYKWGSCLKSLTAFQIAFELLNQFQCVNQETFYLKQLDVALVEADSYGQRQVVMILGENEQRKESKSPKALLVLRLSSNHTEQNLVNFRALYSAIIEKKETLLEKNQTLIIDFRIPHLAFFRVEE